MPIEIPSTPPLVTKVPRVEKPGDKTREEQIEKTKIKKKEKEEKEKEKPSPRSDIGKNIDIET